MRLESCRKCGKEFQIKQRCNVCNLPLVFHCVICGNTTEKQYHSSCTV